jgi:hypothetical protein
MRCSMRVVQTAARVRDRSAGVVSLTRGDSVDRGRRRSLLAAPPDDDSENLSCLRHGQPGGPACHDANAVLVPRACQLAAASVRCTFEVWRGLRYPIPKRQAGVLDIGRQFAPGAQFTRRCCEGGIRSRKTRRG